MTCIAKEPTTGLTCEGEPTTWEHDPEAHIECQTEESLRSSCIYHPYEEAPPVVEVTYIDITPSWSWLTPFIGSSGGPDITAEFRKAFRLADMVGALKAAGAITDEDIAAAAEAVQAKFGY